MSSRYVETKAARQAVAGREAEIVEALGVAWTPGRRGHIDCPYPDHGGKDDWRLTERGRAICTCTGSKSDDVFAIAGKIERLNFTDAKIRCVEIVGRADLIRERLKGDAFQATDPDSLMQAPAGRRRDALVRTYLAHRLGIEPEAVPMPATPVIGLRALTYFDAPEGRAKPIKVGAYPCAVFIQVDAQGRRHAHRIYLAPAGAGKADLGLRADGERRDPKKSARNLGSESTAGRVVVWGEAESAPWCILAEGVETATAVAFAFRPEIERGELYVAAGVTASGVEAFLPWAATERVIVAADRDEAVDGDRPGPSRRGERAARVFCTRQAGRLALAIALPGEPDTKADWLDIHGTGGPEAVRTGILAAVDYVPTAADGAVERRRGEDREALAQVARDYPVPDLAGLTLAYQRTRDGTVWLHQEITTREGVVMVPVATPFGVLARLRFADQGNAYGLRVAVQDMGGHRREIDIGRETLGKQAAAETRALLFGEGLRTDDEGETIAVRCLKAANPGTEISIVGSPGWHSLADADARFFVCPSGRIAGAPAEGALELSAQSRIGETVATGGTLEGWKAAITVAASVSGCPHWTIGALAGFAGPLIALLGLDTCGLNLSGRNSGGKTTALRLAVSAWSRATTHRRDSLLQTARATANGVEAMASRANATILALDELGHVDGTELGKIIYSLASGVGKSRMSAAGALRPSHTWSTFVFLSSEKSLEEKIRGDGGEWYGGMAARIPDVDITGVDRAVDAAVRARIQAVDEHFGHAGPTFVAALIEHGGVRQVQKIRDGIDENVAVLAGLDADASLKRAALPFAILTAAGTLAQRFGILPDGLDIHGAIHWAWGRFRASTDAMALDPETQATALLRSYIAQHWDSSIYSTEPMEGGRAPGQKARGWYDAETVYIPREDLVAAAGGTLKEVEVARALDRQGFIAKRKSERHLCVAYVPKLGKVAAYALCRKEFGREARRAAFSGHDGAWG
ncbi:DUF927 domain-containing protein [Methylobacterium sp. A49B]